MGLPEAVVPTKVARHIQCLGSVRLVEGAVEELGAFVARVKGENRKEPVPAQPEERPPLSVFLAEAPERLAVASTQIHNYLIELGDLLF